MFPHREWCKIARVLGDIYVSGRVPAKLSKPAMLPANQRAQSHSFFCCFFALCDSDFGAIAVMSCMGWVCASRVFQIMRNEKCHSDCAGSGIHS